MDKEDLKGMVPIQACEYAAARVERTIKRLVIALIIAIVLMFATNAFWIYTWNQYDYSNVTVDSQDSGVANYMGAHASGDITNGSNSSKDTDTQKSTEGEKDAK